MILFPAFADVKDRMLKFARRRIWLLALTVLLLPAALLVRPAAHLLRATLGDKNALEPLTPGVTNDASRLNRTQVAEIWPIPTDPATAEQQLARLLARARQEKLPISIAGARHSMGG